MFAAVVLRAAGVALFFLKRQLLDWILRSELHGLFHDRVLRILSLSQLRFSVRVAVLSRLAAITAQLRYRYLRQAERRLGGNLLIRIL